MLLDAVIECCDVSCAATASVLDLPLRRDGGVNLGRRGFLLCSAAEKRGRFDLSRLLCLYIFYFSIVIFFKQ